MKGQSVTEIFGTNVFNDAVMKERLPKKVYQELKKTIEKGETLNPDIADTVAQAMMEWAVEKGATHYTHWFQPMSQPHFLPKIFSNIPLLCHQGYIWVMGGSC